MKNGFLIFVSVLSVMLISSCQETGEELDQEAPVLKTFQLRNPVGPIAAGDTLLLEVVANDNVGLNEFYFTFFSYYNNNNIPKEARVVSDTLSPMNVRATPVLSGNTLSTIYKIPVPINTTSGYYLGNGWVTDRFGNVSALGVLDGVIANDHSPSLVLSYPEKDETIRAKHKESKFIRIKGESSDDKGLMMVEVDVYAYGNLYILDHELQTRFSFTDSIKGETSVTFDREFYLNPELELPKGNYKLHVKAWDNDTGYPDDKFRIRSNVTSQVFDLVID